MTTTLDHIAFAIPDPARAVRRIIKLTRSLLTWLACVALLGCSSMPSGDPSPELADKRKGVLLASVTSDLGKSTYDAWFYLRRKGEEDKSKAIRLAANGFSVIGNKTDFPDRTGRIGRLLAVPLEPGEYELFSWTIYIQTFGGYGYISPRKAPPPLPFTVTPGGITYLGYLHLNTLMGKNLLGIDIPASGSAEIADAFFRDQSLMWRKFPMLNDWPIERVPLSEHSWATVDP